MNKFLVFSLFVLGLNSCEMLSEGNPNEVVIEEEENTDETNDVKSDTVITDVEAVTKTFSYFTDDLTSLKKQALVEEKKIILFFGAAWCGPCKTYKNKTFLEPDSYAYLNEHYIVKYYDVETDFDGIEFQQKYKIQVLPTLIFFSKDFTELNQIKGHLGGYTFYRRIKEINEGV